MQQIRVIKEMNGDVLTGQESVLRRYKDIFERLMNVGIEQS